MAFSANFHIKIAFDICAAFLQSKVLDREVYVEPLSDIKKQGIVWKLNKPLYGLDDASRKFWLRVRDVFLNKLKLKTVEGDKAFYYCNLDGDFHGAVLTHVDDFEVTGTTDFVEEIISMVEKELTISKVEEDIVRYTGLDVKMIADGIEISMDKYSKSLQNITEIRKTKGRNQPLTKEEIKFYRKMTGKIAWLANSTRPDLCYQALQMSKKNQGATISDLRDINRILNWV